MTKPWWTRALLGRTTVSNPLQDDEGGDPQFEAQWRGLVKKRVFAILAFLGLWVASLEGRLIWVQVVSHGHWVKEAAIRQQNTETIQAPRGAIRDRNGRLLAYSVRSYDLYVNANKVVDPDKDTKFKEGPAVFAKRLCQALADCEPGEEAAIVAKLLKPKSAILIRRANEMSIDAVAGVRVFAKDLGRWQELVQLRPKEARFYPNMSLAAQVIGFVDANGPGLSGAAGVEKKFDQLLRGTAGKEIRQVDANGREILATVISAPKPGASIELTIDLSMQEILERELARGVEEAGALGGTAIVLDASNSQVLAMGNLPTYNLNLPGKAERNEDVNAHRNRAAQDLYEPGSTFKLVTLAAALNEGVVHTTTLLDTSRRPFMVDGRSRPITEDKNHNYGVLDVEGVLVRSSNIGAALVGLRLGPDLLQRYAAAFGFAPREGPGDFFSENFGRILVPKEGLNKGSLATVSYGYQVRSTPLQMANAVNVFATGGFLMRPTLVHAIVDAGVRRVNEPQVISRVVTPQTAATMITMLEAVVEDGTGDRAALARYRVGGKTGTTKKFVDKAYSEKDYLVSFVGLAPTRHPRFTIIVVVDRPTKVPAYGGAVSAPIFKRIAEALLHYVGEPPSVNPAPAVVVTEESPKNLRPPRPADVPVFVNAGGVPAMPDLAGLTLRDALRRLPPGMTMNWQGDGVVVSQSPAAGEPISTTRGTLRLQRQPVKTGGSSR